MGLPIVTILEGDAPYEQGYHNEEGRLLPSSKTPVEENQEVPTQKEEEDEARWQAESLRPGRHQWHLVRALDRLPVEGGSSGLVWGVLKRHPRTFPEMEEDGRLREADEKDG
jgi:hypothetical protein